MTMFLHFQATTQAVQPPEQCKRMTSSRWRAASLTAATGRQSWDGSTQVTTSLMTTSPWQPTIRRSLHSWRLQRLLVCMALRLFVLLTSLNRHHFCRPQLLTYRVTRTPGRHRHSTYSVSNATNVLYILLLHFMCLILVISAKRNYIFRNSDLVYGDGHPSLLCSENITWR